uniref:Uncharacterized protein n=1 Tax=Plectus sambesii TaxID=2011161 RepID=A0A914XSC2_9BILA
MPREIARVRPPSVRRRRRPPPADDSQRTRGRRDSLVRRRSYLERNTNGRRRSNKRDRDLTNDTRANMTAPTRPRNRQNTIDDSSPDFFHLPLHSGGRPRALCLSPLTHTAHTLASAHRTYGNCEICQIRPLFDANDNQSDATGGDDDAPLLHRRRCRLAGRRLTIGGTGLDGTIASCQNSPVRLAEFPPFFSPILTRRAPRRSSLAVTGLLAVYRRGGRRANRSAR